MKDAPGVQWRMLLNRDEMWLAPPNGPAVELTHLEFAEHVNVIVAGELCILGIKGLEPVKTLQIAMSGIDPLLQWMALRRDLHVGAALKKRLKLAVPLGLALTLLSLSALATPEARLDVLNTAFGVS